MKWVVAQRVIAHTGVLDRNARVMDILGVVA